MNSKILVGKLGEQAAAELYAKHQFKILARNFHNRKGRMLGEIDFVAVKNSHLHFVEIKTRAGSSFGTGLEALTRLKQIRIIRAARFFIRTLPHFANFQAHFDLVAVQIDRFDKSVQSITIHSDVIDDLAEV